MSSTSPIDKYRDTIAARLNEILLALRVQPCPDTLLLDKDFMDINTVHPTLYSDLLLPWQPMSIFPSADIIVNDFTFPVLPYVAPTSELSELSQILTAGVTALLEDINQYLSNTWTAAYKDVLDQYEIARSQWISGDLEFWYMQNYAIKSDGTVKKLLDYFSPWLSPTQLSIEKPVNWHDCVKLLNAADTIEDILNAVEGYLLTVIAATNQRHKPIREIPMPVSVTDFGKEIDAFIASRTLPPDTVAYAGVVAYTYGINLLANESEVRGKYYHLIGKDVGKETPILTVDQRIKALYVITAPLSLSFLYDAAFKNLATMVFITE